MYNQTITLGAEAQFKLYGAKGDQVIQAQLDATKVKGATEESIKLAMTKKAAEIGFISAHSKANYEDRNAIDITRSDYTKDQIETIKSEYKNIDPNSDFLDEPDRNCLHFEIPTQDASYYGGILPSVTIEAQGNSYLKPLPAVIINNSQDKLIQ